MSLTAQHILVYNRTVISLVKILNLSGDLFFKIFKHKSLSEMFIECTTHIFVKNDRLQK